MRDQDRINLNTAGLKELTQRIARKDGTPREHEFPAAWLLTRRFASEWLSFVQRQEPPAIWEP